MELFAHSSCRAFCEAELGVAIKHKKLLYAAFTWLWCTQLLLSDPWDLTASYRISQAWQFNYLYTGLFVVNTVRIDSSFIQYKADIICLIASLRCKNRDSHKYLCNWLSRRGTKLFRFHNFDNSSKSTIINQLDYFLLILHKRNVYAKYIWSHNIKKRSSGCQQRPCSGVARPIYLDAMRINWCHFNETPTA